MRRSASGPRAESLSTLAPIAAHVEREVALRAAMFGTIIVLVVFILVTPTLLGRPSELTSVPVLIVAMTHDESSFIVDVTGAVQAYLYENISLHVSTMGPGHANTTRGTYARNDTYNAAIYVPANATPLFIHARLVDQQGNYFEYNLTVGTFNDSANANKLTLVFTFPDDAGTTARYVVPPTDFRWAVPRRGMVTS